jgi:predicted nucleic acid-binding protein
VQPLKKVIADSSSLILLAKCNLLEDVAQRFEVLVPTAVSEEAAADNLRKKYPDAALIASMIDQGAIKVTNPGESRLPLPFPVHRGEKEALLLSLQWNKALLATDDGRAIKAARFLNIPFIISPKMVVELSRWEWISSSKARLSLEKLGKIGRYSPEIIADALISLLEVKNG